MRRRRVRPADGRRDDRHAQPARAQAADLEEDPVAAALHLVGAAWLRGADQGRARGRRRARRRADRRRQYDQLAGPADRHHQHPRHRLHAGQRDRLLPRRRVERLPDAVARAREFVRVALHDAPGLGQGAGPIGQAARPARRRRRPAAQPGDGDRHQLRSARSTSTAGSASSRSSTVRPTMRVSRPRAARPSRSRSIPTRRSSRRPRSISNATTSTSASSSSRAAASRSSTARATSRGCGARRGCATPTATSSSSTRRAKRAASRRGGWTNSPQTSSSPRSGDPAEIRKIWVPAFARNDE